MISASFFANAVFPTPVGPMNNKDAIGFDGLSKDDFTAERISQSPSIAFDCPKIADSKRLRMTALLNGIAGLIRNSGRLVSSQNALMATSTPNSAASGKLRNKFSKILIGFAGKPEYGLKRLQSPMVSTTASALTLIDFAAAAICVFLKTISKSPFSDDYCIAIFRNLELSPR
jgi:hypothetical protein